MDTDTVPVTLKWNKQTFSLVIELGETARSFKERVQSQTGVPIARQKLLAKKGGWKGPLKDDDTILDSRLIKDTSTTLTVTLIGSAETLVEPKEKTTVFIEDLSPEDLRAAEEAQAQAAMATAVGMIPALQLPPHRRDDHKQEMYQYNRLVSGLPQRQIEQDLKYGQQQNGQLQGKVAMNLGLELRRAYINDFALLRDGTCISVMDDGHVQLWKHASQQQDVVHPGASSNDGGVDSVVALDQQPSSSPLAFATAGSGTLQFWTADADPILTLRGGMPGTSPASLACVFGNSSNDGAVVCLAARMQVTRLSDPMQFHLPPQNAAERQRRAQAEAQEQAIQQALAKASRSVQVWYYVGKQEQSAGALPSLQSRILEPPNATLEGSAPVTSLVSFAPPDAATNSSRLLIAGDSAGGLRIWSVQHNNQSNSLEFHHQAIYQLQPSGASCSVVCMQVLQGGHLLAVSTEASPSPQYELSASTPISVEAPRAVHILDLSTLLEPAPNSIPKIASTLMGHSDKDAVICMCELPNGDLLTGGGKLDATVQLWPKSQFSLLEDKSTEEAGLETQQLKATKTLSDVGYVFALQVLPDAKHDSNFYAVAAGRYNTVKIII